jgi:hypothetical protein
MNLDQLSKANEIANKIEVCKKNIERANYTQLENVVIRESSLKFNGIDEPIIIPENLFRVIGKLILAEYQTKLIELETKFKTL